VRSDANKKYLVTGGTGFLGSNLVRALVARGDEVRVLDNNFRGSAAKLGAETLQRIEFIEADIRDRERVLEAVEGMDVVCHLAFINGTRYFYEIPEVVLDVGIKGTMNTLEACVDCGVKEYVFASSSEVYQTPPSVPTAEEVPGSVPDTLNPRYSYGGAKLIGEVLAFNYGREKFDRTVVFRPHNVYGPDMGFEHVIPEFVVRLRRAARESNGGPIDFPIQGDGSETRAFNNVHDFVRGLLLVLDRGEDRNIYHIGTDEEITIRELAETIARKMGLEIRLQTSPRRAGGTPRRCPDIGKLRALGYEPQLRLADGLDESIRWYGDWADRNPE
jgi:dTDP-glucose 4,6-dehydratase/UDP-glucose 4-epimerase